MSLGLTNKIAILRDRSHLLQKARHFFAERDILEVDVPLLTRKAPIDLHIDLVKAYCMKEQAFLQSSPEYGMKRLLADGIGDIYQISHVFRDGEKGERHNPEFTMVEWYRIGMSFDELIEETRQFLRLFLEVEAFEIFTYEQVFQKYADIHIEKYDGDKEILFANEVEPFLGNGKFSVIIDFPPEMAALSQVIEKKGKKVAERFEFFYKGVELANGYHELIDPLEQRHRFHKANEERVRLGKEAYPVDNFFLEALEKGLDDMCGVACGFDRLMMLRHSSNHIEEVISFSWNQT